MRGTVGRDGVVPATGEVAPPPLGFPDCPHRGGMIESGEGCGCGPKHLCKMFTKIVGARDCLDCLATARGRPPDGHPCT